MKNVLFIGPYRQSCSWGIASRMYIKALHKAGFNVCIRPIYMGTNLLKSKDLDILFLELENNKYDHYDCVIQNVLPHLLDYDARYGKNIALFYTETTGWENSWPRKLNTMDEIWVPSNADTLNVLNSKVKTPIKNIPIPIDLNKFNEPRPTIEGIDKEDFNFYYIGEFVERKNLDVLLKAFHTEFDSTEPVNLIIKTHSNISNFDDVLQNYIANIKDSLRTFSSKTRYKEDILITSFLSEEALYSLHETGHCLVVPSSGESWCLPVVDAMGFGKIPLVTKGIGPYYNIPDQYKEFCSIDSVEETVIIENPPLLDLYTGSEYYFKPLIRSLKQKMRFIYENRNSELMTKISESLLDKVEEFSIENVADLIKESI